MTVSSSSKIVLVTGANQGIGFEIAKSLSSKPGYHVLVGSRDTQRGIDAAQQLQEQGFSAEPIAIEYVTLYCPKITPQGWIHCVGIEYYAIRNLKFRLCCMKLLVAHVLPWNGLHTSGKHYAPTVCI